MRRPAGGLQKIQGLKSHPAGDLGGESGFLQLPQLLKMSHVLPFDSAQGTVYKYSRSRKTN